MQDFAQNTLDDEVEDSHGPSDVGLPPEPTADDGANEYFAELPTWQLIVEVRRLMAAECRAERLVCRYLADLADRVRQRSDATLMAYSDEFDAIRHCFGLGLREARERLRVGRALRQLPQLERAFVAGELAYSRIREVTRVATPQTELEWLSRARHLNMRQLERRVAQPADPLHRDPPRHDTRPPADERRTTPLQRITFELSFDAWTLVQRALQQVRTVTGSDLSNGEALEILARGALARAVELEDHTSPADPSEAPEASPAPPRAAGGPPAETASDEGAPQSSTGPVGDSTGVFADATQGGSSSTGIPYPSGDTVLSPRERQLVAIGALPDDPAARALLELMDDRYGWTTDELIEASGWSHSEVACALVLLEIGHWVQRDFFSWLIVKTQRSRLAR